MNPSPPRTTVRRQPSPSLPPWRLLLLLLPLLSTSAVHATSHLRRRTTTYSPNLRHTTTSSSSSLQRWLQTAHGNVTLPIATVNETTSTVESYDVSTAKETAPPQSPAAAANVNENDESNTQETATTTTVTSLETIESELIALQNTDDESLTDDELNAKLEKENELIQEEVEVLESSSGGGEGMVGVWDDDDDDEAGDDLLGGVMDAEDLQEELEEVEKEIAELDEQDDDGAGAEYKEAFKEELTDIKNDLEEVIYEGAEVGDDDGYEVYRPVDNSTISMAKSANITAAGVGSVMLGGQDSLPPNINIDPTLTMDLTQYNSPSDNAPKEAFSSAEGTSNMENEVDRHGVNGTLPGESEIVNEDSEGTAKVSPSATAGSGLANVDNDDAPVQSTPEKSVTQEVAGATAGPTVEKDVDVSSSSNPVTHGTEEANKTVSWTEESKDDDILPPPSKIKQSASEEEVTATVSGKEDDDDDDYVPPQSISDSVTTNMTTSTTQDNSGDEMDSALSSAVPIAGSESAANTTVSTLQDISGSPIVSSENISNKTVSKVKDSSANELDANVGSPATVVSSENIANKTGSTIEVSPANELGAGLNSTRPAGEETSAVKKDDDGDQDVAQENPITAGSAGGNDSNATTTSAQGVGIGMESSENDDDEAVDVSSTGEALEVKNTTAIIPTESAGPKDDFSGNKIPVDVNATAKNPISEPTESTIAPINTGVAKVEGTTESTTPGSTTTSQTTSTETTPAAAVKTPVVTQPPHLDESSTSTVTTPSPTPSPTYYPTKDLEANA
eukprot:CCRYP_013538-RA/>CCRYP_013538-RA protein AED:0.16 eAED:0.16 QI:170/1/0.5/1/1/0.5/2/0/789